MKRCRDIKRKRLRTGHFRGQSVRSPVAQPRGVRLAMEIVAPFLPRGQGDLYSADTAVEVCMPERLF